MTRLMFAPLTAVAVALLVMPAGVSGAGWQRRSRAPRTVGRDVRAACEVAYLTAEHTPGAVVRRRTGLFSDETLLKPVFGCGLAISGSFARADATGDAAVRLREAFARNGWNEMAAYGADGTDGTSFAYRKSAVVCLVRGTWDGGAEPDLPAQDWYRVAAFCTGDSIPDSRGP